MINISQHFIDFLLHLDAHLIAFVSAYGKWTYALLFTIIFCETGIILTAILPGDSLLFAAGALTSSSNGALNVHILFALLVVGSVLGNGLNYYIGQWLGSKIMASTSVWRFAQPHINRAHAFYARYGAKTILIARFIPMVRTFAPFVAGIAYMPYRAFMGYSVVGAFLWIGILIYGGHLFGHIAIVKQHFSFVVIGIIVISIVPAILTFLREKYRTVS